MTDIDKPKVGDIYTAKQIKDNGWSPCIDCKKSRWCAEQCMWAYWNNGKRENTRYKYAPEDISSDNGWKYLND